MPPVLPDDALVIVFTYGARVDVSRHWGCVCRRWRDAAVDPRIWGSLSLRDPCFTRDEAALADLVRSYGAARLRVAEALTLRLPTRQAYYSVVQALGALAAQVPRLRCLCVTGCGEIDAPCIEAFSRATPCLEVLQAGGLEEGAAIPRRAALPGEAVAAASPAAMWQRVTAVCLEEPAAKRRRQCVEALAPPTMAHLTTAVVLSFLPHWGALRVVDIAGWGVTDVCVDAMAAQLTNLTHLSLESCARLTARAAGALSKFPALEVVNVSRLLTGTPMWQALAAAPPRRLRCLLAARSLLHRASLAALAASAGRLTTLCLPDLRNPKGVDMAGFCAARLPAVRVVLTRDAADACFAAEFEYTPRQPL
eukprot:TRINITY_DN22089_c0_g1_i1.p1 TRINITY_DN22089_c0_g1~~TRINITY_DN22089_c0_g1_i1.p1  ORF type:complete len:365 (+),score=85.93 TRINITY_DN22089_c0_g1_i1:60-1154(+)